MAELNMLNCDWHKLLYKTDFSPVEMRLFTCEFQYLGVILKSRHLFTPTLYIVEVSEVKKFVLSKIHLGYESVPTCFTV